MTTGNTYFSQLLEDADPRVPGREGDAAEGVDGGDADGGGGGDSDVPERMLAAGPVSS
jgi:hypothetical protein